MTDFTNEEIKSVAGCITDRINFWVVQRGTYECKEAQDLFTLRQKVMASMGGGPDNDYFQEWWKEQK